MAKPLKVVVEKHPGAYVAYPLGAKGVVVGEGHTYEDALADVRSALDFHLESFGRDALESETVSSSGPGSAGGGSSG